MTIDALPTAPNRNMTPEAFIAAADAFVAALNTMVSQTNADLNLILNLAGLLATSTSSVLIGTGSKSFTVETSKAYLPTQSVRVYSTASPANYMLGTVTSYDAGTGALVVNVTSVGGSGTLAAWTVVLAASGEWLGNATSATSATNLTGSGTVSATTTGGAGLTPDRSNRVDSGMVTVASHATTGDIFAAAANTIDWTGTATTTTFPNAQKAGMRRTLICAAACQFVSNAALAIEGSNGTVTMNAGAVVEVVALTVSTFKITYSLSGTFTATGTGFTVNPTTTAKFSVTNGVVSIYIPTGALVGTSNATSFTVTGLPACLTPNAARSCGLIHAEDNTAQVSGLWEVSGTTLTLGNGLAQYQGAWTASGGKRLLTTDFVYSL